MGSWESLKNVDFPPSYREKLTTWEELTSYRRLYEEHLKGTIVMLFSCVARGDRDGAEWLTDVLQKWWN